MQLEEREILRFSPAKESCVDDIDGGFYRELLYIMGLQEVAERGRHLIKRMPEGQRACGSLLEQAFTLLDDFFPSPDQTEQRLDAALGLVMVWVNRILFLRLLETQLVNFNGGDRMKAYQVRVEGVELAVTDENGEFQYNPASTDSRILSHALEWRYEFPEILDDEGQFVGFDIIIGNPPYGVQMDDEYRMRVEAHWKHVPDYEIYFYFLELAHAIARQGGLVSFIIPNTWLFNVNAEVVRKWLLQEWDILEVLDCSDIRIFDKATVRNAILTMQARESSLDESEVESVAVGYRNTKGLREECEENNRKPFNALVSRPLLHVSGKSLVKDFSQNWALAFRLTEEEKGIVEKIKANSFPLKDVFTEVSQGLIAYDKLKGQSDEIIRSRAYHSHVYKEGYKKWLLGEDVRRYCVKWNGKEYVNYCDGIANPRNPRFFRGKRLLVREITNPSIYAAITDEELYHDPAVIVVKDCDAYSLELVCGIMNSKLGTFYHFNNSPKATKGLFPKILIADINNFPLPKLDTDGKKALAARIEPLAMRLMEAAAKGNAKATETRQMEDEVNQLVCQLYGLDEEETNVAITN